jgi:PIN domain nuclease of toxin-antitoxin system
LSEVVLDASAVLALLNEEPGREAVAAAFPHAVISAVNLSEVVAKMMDFGIPAPSAQSAIEDLGLQVHPFDEGQAVTAGLLRRQTRSLGLSLGDRACLALGLQLGLPVLTTDRSWKSLDLGVAVRSIR